MRDWKQPPQDPQKKWLNTSLEMQILLACNWNCCACDAYSNFHSVSWVKKGTMTTQQIAHFQQEVVTANGYFGRIRILGGEPTLHPKFSKIVEMLHELVVQGHVGFLELVTNGSHPEKILPVRHLIQKVRISGEKAKERNHVANLRQTPASLGYSGTRCNQPEYCGWSLSYYGYSPCSSGAGIIRLRSLAEQQRSHLPIVDKTETAWPDLQSLCDHCYHGLRDEDKIRCGTKGYEQNTPSHEVWNHLGPWLEGKSYTGLVYGPEEVDH